MVYKAKLNTMKADQERLKQLLTEAVKVFLNDNVPCHNVTSVEGLMGLTLGNEVFLVYVNESCSGVVGCTATDSETCCSETSAGLDIV